MANLLSRVRLLLSLCLLISGCTTHTVLDFVFQDWNLESHPHERSTVNAVCNVLEDKGYKFDRFNMYDTNVLITYPNGETETYPVYSSVASRLLTDIERQYMSRDGSLASPVSEVEQERLLLEAQNLCQDIQEVMVDFSPTNADVVIVLYDWEEGISIRYETTETSVCSSLTPNLVATGSSGEPEQFESSICGE